MLQRVWHTRCVHAHVDEIIRALRVHTPVDERERLSIDRFLHDVPGLADPFSEDAGPVHVTASAIVVSEGGDKVALHLHKRLGMWLQPGGHIERGEDPASAALREAHEELGVRTRHHGGHEVLFHLDVHPGPKGHTHHDLRYLVRAPEHPLTPGEGESPDARWFTWDDAMAIADDGLVGALRAARALLS